MKLLRSIRGERRTAADIRGDIAKVDMAGLSAKVNAIEQQRRQFLLTGTDAQLEDNGRELAAARLQVERAETLLDELTRLAGEAEAREAEEQLEAERVGAMMAKDVIDTALADAETAAAQLKVHLDAAAAAAGIVARWNHRVGPVPAGQPDRRIPHTSPETAKLRLLGGLR